MTKSQNSKRINARPLTAEEIKQISGAGNLWRDGQAQEPITVAGNLWRD